MDLIRKIAIYEKMFKFDGFKVLDTSFLDISWNDKIGRLADFARKREAINAGIDFYDFLNRAVDNSVTFPSETIEEFARLKLHFSRFSRSLRYSKHSDSKMIAFHKALKKIIDKQKNLINHVFESHKTEQYFTSDMEWQEKFLPAILDVSKREGIKIDHRVHYKSPFSSNPRHDDNDERIFAKSLELSRFYPVFLLTKDSDFNRMHEVFYANLVSLTKRYGLCAPRFGVNIVFFNEGNENYFIFDPSLKRTKYSI